MVAVLSIAEKLQRLLYREFLLEPGLLEEVGLEEVPRRLAALLQCAESQAVETLVESPFLEALELEQLRELLTIRDMTVVSRTAAAISAELKAPGVSLGSRQSHRSKSLPDVCAMLPVLPIRYRACIG